MIIEERIIRVKKITKFIRGHSYIVYDVLAAIGDGNGGVGYGKAKSRDQNFSYDNAINRAKKKFFRVPLVNGGIYHEVFGKHCNSTVTLYPSRFGSGIFAGGAIRDVIEVSGITNIISKLYGSNNTYNVVIALFNALKNLTSIFHIIKKRGKKFKNFF